MPTSILDESRALQFGGIFCDTLPPHAEHVRD
jgi:hypothetical protein